MQLLIATISVNGVSYCSITEKTTSLKLFIVLIFHNILYILLLINTLVQCLRQVVDFIQGEDIL